MEQGVFHNRALNHFLGKARFTMFQNVTLTGSIIQTKFSRCLTKLRSTLS